MNLEQYGKALNNLDAILNHLEDFNDNIQKSEYKENYLKITNRIQQDLNVLSNAIQIERKIKVNPELANRIID